MALIRPQGKLSWMHSASSDVATYYIYQGTPAVLPDYTSPNADVGYVNEVELPIDGLPPVEGEVVFGLAAVDHAGNISDIRPAEAVLIDVTPPEAPNDIRFTPFLSGA